MKHKTLRHKWYLLLLPFSLIAATAISCGATNTNTMTTPPPSTEGDLVDVDMGVTNRPGPNENRPGFNIPGKPANADSEQYRNADEKTRWGFDIQAYRQALLQHLQTTPEQVRQQASQQLHNNSEQANPFAAYDAQAANVNQYDYFTSYLLGYSVKDHTNKLQPQTSSVPAAPYWNSIARNRGKARFLPNQMYKDIALQTFAIDFLNEKVTYNQSSQKLETGITHTYGTGWILDYELPTNSNGQATYPTKWYVATNLHVADAFVKDAKANNANNSQAIYQNTGNVADELASVQKIKDEVFAKHAELVAAVEAIDQQLKANPSAEKIAELNQKRAELLQENVANNKRFDLALQRARGVTKTIQLQSFSNQTPLGSNLQVNTLANTLNTFTFNPNQVKIVYAGLDFLTTSPKDYVATDNPFYNGEEYIDFAVLEFDFSNVTSYQMNGISGLKHEITGKMGSEVANVATNNFAFDGNLKNKDHGKITNSSQLTTTPADVNNAKQQKPTYQSVSFNAKTLVDQYDQLRSEMVEVELSNSNQKTQTSKLNVGLYGVGFPISSTDDQFSQEDIAAMRDVPLGFTQSLWINKPKDLSGTLQYGSGLSRSLAFRSSTSMPGIGDNVIINPTGGFDGGAVWTGWSEKDHTTQPNNTHLYLNYGLTYTLNNWTPLGGSSGSSIRDFDGNIIAINYLGADLAQSNLAVALRSNKIDYQGLYGSYNLEAYDLIYGGAPKQRTSYKDALFKLHANIKTSLFPNGNQVTNNTSVVPAAFQFKKEN